MYRIADKYCINDLRTAALQHIAGDISKSTLRMDLDEREEITMFPEIKDLYRNFCKACYHGLGSDLDEHIEGTLGLDVSELSKAAAFSMEDALLED